MTRNVLCIVAGPEGYGVRRIWATLICALLEHDWVVTIAILEREHARSWKEQFPSATVVEAEKTIQLTATADGTVNRVVSLLRRGIKQLSMMPWLRQLAKAHRTDCILFQGPLESALAGLIACSVGVKAYWFVPNAIDTAKSFDINRRIYKSLFRYANVIPVSNSHHTDSTFGPGKFERHVVHLGVDTDHYAPNLEPDTIRNKLAIPEHAPLIGLFARMNASKGQLRLIEALAKTEEEFHVLLCGGPLNGHYFETLCKRVAALNLKNRVHIAGPQADLRPYYAACDMIANLYDGVEGFGLTLAEGMASGKPAFAHGAGGPSEIVVDGESGWLIPTSDPDAIVAGLRRIASDQSRWKSMGRSARERAVANFSERRFKSEAIELLASDIEVAHRK